MIHTELEFLFILEEPMWASEVIAFSDSELVRFERWASDMECRCASPCPNTYRQARDYARFVAFERWREALEKRLPVVKPLRSVSMLKQVIRRELSRRERR